VKSTLLNKLSPKDQKKISSLAIESPIRAIKELRDLTQCSIGEGKFLVNNLREENYRENLPPCPFCGEKLRTPSARQCRFCLHDWHDENNLKRLK
jgi:hypothetical protein